MNKWANLNNRQPRSLTPPSCSPYQISGKLSDPISSQISGTLNDPIDHPPAKGKACLQALLIPMLQHNHYRDCCWSHRLPTVSSFIHVVVGILVNIYCLAVSREQEGAFILELLDAVKISKMRMASKSKRENYKFSNPSMVNGISSSWSWISTSVLVYHLGVQYWFSHVDLQDSDAHLRICGAILVNWAHPLWWYNS